MRNVTLLTLIVATLLLANCKKDNEDDRFEMITKASWKSDSLLVNGQDASGPGERLEEFKGSAKFNKDGTGTFGVHSGTWGFSDNTRQSLWILTPSFPVRINTNIVELTSRSLKITTQVPDLTGDEETLNIRMTFKAN